MDTHGKVPMFKMKPHMGTLMASLAVLILGVAFFFNGHQDPGDIPAHERADLVLAVAIILAGLLFIIATGRMWFTHLWHDRYK